MKTGLKKSQKTTEIFFDEASRWITVNTYNTDLKNRLTAYAKKHPDLYRLTDDYEDGSLSFEIAKGRFCFRLTEPYSDERRAFCHNVDVTGKRAERVKRPYSLFGG